MKNKNSLNHNSSNYLKIKLYKFTLICFLISLNCTDERSCYTDRCIQEVLRFALHLKSSFPYKNPASDSSLNVAGEIRMHISAHGSCQTLHLHGLSLNLANARIFQTDKAPLTFFQYKKPHLGYSC